MTDFIKGASDLDTRSGEGRHGVGCMRVGGISYLETYTRDGQSETTDQAHGPGPPNGRAPPEHVGGACGFIGRLSQTLFNF